MSSWNPVEGLEQIDQADIVGGDHIRIVHEFQGLLEVTDFVAQEIELISEGYGNWVHVTTVEGGSSHFHRNQEHWQWYLVERGNND